MSCVPAGTGIATASGQKNIEEIQVKDLVLSYNVRSKVRELRRVSNIFVRESSSLVAIFLDNGDKLICTAEHPVYVDKIGFVDAGNIDKYVGYFIVGVEKYPRIKSVVLISGRKEKVYNLEVEINNNYFANNILVHNCTAFAYNEWLKGKRVIANYQLAFVEHFIKTCRDPRVQDVEDVQKIYGLEPPDTFSLDYFVEHLTDKEIYNCLPAGAEISVKNPEYQPRKEDGTRDGHGSIVQKKIEDIEVGDYALSFNEKTREKEFKKVVHVFNTRTSWVFVNLVFSNGNHLRCTPGHPVYLSDGTVKQVSELKEGDRIIQYKYSGLNLRCTKGKKYLEMYGKEKAEEVIRNKKELMTGRSYSECMTPEMEEQTRKKKSETMKETWKTSEGLNGEERSRKISEKLVGDPERSARSKRNADAGISGFKRARELGTLPTFADHWKNPESAKKLRKHVEKHTTELLHLICPTKLELKLKDFLDEKFPGKWEYTGDGKVWFNGCNPDFVYSGSNKVLEVFTEYHKNKIYGSVENYIQIRTERFAVAGKEVLYIWDTELEDSSRLLNKIEIFIHNPKVDIVTVTSSVVEMLQDPEKVYDIEVEDNHNIYVYGILTKQSYLIFDEAYLYMDSRNTATRMNKLFSWFLAQTRKRGVDLAICIGENTSIITPEGYRKIQDIRVGDSVFSFSADLHQEFQKVLRVYEKPAKEIISLDFSDGSQLNCTPEHPILNLNLDIWTEAQYLKLNDKVFHSYRNEVYVRNKNISSFDGQVYNLEVEKNNNYFANNILTHNCTIHYDHLDKRLRRAVTLRVLCFPGSVKVLIADDSDNVIHRNICDVKVGDRVLSHDRFGENEFRKVTEVHIRKTREIWTLRFSNDVEAKCTPEHPFFVGGLWIRARDLKIGDTCLSYSHGPIRFKGYGTSYYSEIDVYNLEVEKNQNYFANDVLVHNCRYNERRKVVTSRMIDLKSGNRNTIHLYAPDFWDLYDTREIIDVPAGQVYLPDSLSISGKKQ